MKKKERKIQRKRKRKIKRKYKGLNNISLGKD